MRPCYLQNMIACTIKITSLYWGNQVSKGTVHIYDITTYQLTHASANSALNPEVIYITLQESLSLPETAGWQITCETHLTLTK